MLNVLPDMTPVFAVLDAPIIAVIIGAAIILFGAERLPKLARSMGQARKEFEAASRGTPPADAAKDAAAPPPDAQSTPPAQPPAAPPASQPPS
jgi:sec-independent protein translocase protein TatA